MSDLRMAVLSATGTARKRTIPAVTQANICKVVAIHGRDRAKLEEVASEHGIPGVFLDEREMLESTSPDFAFIGSPPTHHLRQLELCIELRIPVLVEKPLALTTEEARAMREASIRSGIPVRVAHHLRHQPGVQAIRSILRTERFGPLRKAAFQWSFWLNNEAPNALWKLDPNQGGPNAFFDAGVHAVDMAIYLLGRIEKLTALGHRERFERTVDNVYALALSRGTIVELGASQAVKFPRNAIDLEFADGSLYALRALGEPSFTQLEVTSKDGTEILEFESVNPYGREVADFISLLKSEESVGTTLDEAVHAVEVLRGIEESRKSGHTIVFES